MIHLSPSEPASVKKMAEEIYNFCDNMMFAVESEFKCDFEFDNIVVCGMGGSAIGGEIIKNCIIDEIGFPIVIQRFPELPKWVNERTLAIICSYSGNTNETLEMFDQALKKGCKIVAMTSGGKVMEIGRKHSITIMEMEKNIQPRSSLGYGIGYMALIMDVVCGTKCRDDIIKCMPSLMKFRDKLSEKGGIAESIALATQDKIPIIYAATNISAAATRWKNQINENSKAISFAGAIPEFNHNDIAGWAEGDLRDKCLPIFLYESSAPKATRSMIKAAISSLEGWGLEVNVVKIKGKTVMDRMLRSIMIGDYVSLYLAAIHQKNPEEVDSIAELKERLKALNDSPSKRNRRK